MKYNAINFKNKLKLFNEHWQPRVIAEMNNYQFKLVKVKGDFVWHHHDDTDETLIFLKGKLRIDFPDGKVTIKKGEMFVVPKGLEHKPYAKKQAKVLVIEPRGVINTGEKNDRTSANDVWI